MTNSKDQVKVLIWPSREHDRITSVDDNGHVELLVRNNCYDFGPDYRLKPSRIAIGRGCNGILLPRPFIAVAVWYLDRVMQERPDEVVFDPRRHEELPIVWSFTFETSKVHIDDLAKFLESTLKEPPLYAAVPRRKNTYNCQTFSLKALRDAGIFEESFDDPHPDALLEFLRKLVGRPPGPIKVEELQLAPPQFLLKVMFKNDIRR